MESWPRLTGGKGVHVMAPLNRRMTHDEAHRYSRTLAEHLSASRPDRYTVSAATGARMGRLLIDYLRNGRGTTAVATYSPRARPGFPIAAPVAWEDIERDIHPDAFTMADPLQQTQVARTRAASKRKSSPPSWVPESTAPASARGERRRSRPGNPDGSQATRTAALS